MGLDTNYKATEQEKKYVKETIEKEGVTELFKKETKNLSQKIIRNFHTENYVLFEKNITFASEKESMKKILNTDPEMKTKYEQAYNKNKDKPGFSEGILLLQAIAIKCVNIINTSESVEKKLSSWNDKAFKSQAMDGILGPNTFYVLASIAKEKGIPFNGIIDKSLLDTMISICQEPATYSSTSEQEDDQKHIEKNDSNQDEEPPIIPTNQTNTTTKNQPENAPNELNKNNISGDGGQEKQKESSPDIVEKIKTIQETIKTYTTTPAKYSIETATGEMVFEYTPSDTPSINDVTSINFILKNDGNEVGIIGFNTKGQLLTKELIKDNKIYTITQSENMLTITEKTADQPVVVTTTSEEEIAF